MLLNNGWLCDRCHDQIMGDVEPQPLDLVSDCKFICDPCLKALERIAQYRAEARRREKLRISYLLGNKGDK